VSATGILLVSCPDQRGIVAAVTAFVAAHGGNVVDLQQHTDHTDGAFFQRVEFELDRFDLDRSELPEAFDPVAERFGMRWALRFSDHRARVALLVSKEPHCLHDLLNRWRTGEMAVDIPLVISNHPDHADAIAWFGVPYQAHERGVKLVGVTAHYATADLDDGPIIDQDVIRVTHRDDVDDLRRKGRDLEVVVLARAVRAHIEHRVLVYGRRTVVFD
jgi:formyltetrahydrofolate deformylase